MVEKAREKMEDRESKGESESRIGESITCEWVGVES